jgi:hypothetical protein
MYLFFLLLSRFLFFFLDLENSKKKLFEHDGCQIRIAMTDTTPFSIVSLSLALFLVSTQEGYALHNMHFGTAVPDSFAIEPWKLDTSTKIRSIII